MEGLKISVAYVLINTKPELEYEVYNKLSKEERIVELNPLYREYDMLAKVNTKNQDNLGLFVKKIRSFEGVIDTKTLQ